ncbi:hypothetical protein [Segnochrobactrum spirostomi]|uniref:Uncharacterized protein n=1 Tax=Segnochrobactrum spirostomi TaxID=2608987 RepID=A0A6A7Y927_9HYPH|nr:hypothetical protein [Segnochrobactrum spirostomi]MQT14481.1 hypothetical protein [Segnochrobactrum spirostomi]
MNTANLQLQGLLLAMTTLMNALERRGALSARDIDAALDEALAMIREDAERTDQLSPANLQAVMFPVRFLKFARGAAPAHTFSEIAAIVGKDTTSGQEAFGRDASVPTVPVPPTTGRDEPSA